MKELHGIDPKKLVLIDTTYKSPFKSK
jgi:hypothetical protein